MTGTDSFGGGLDPENPPKYVPGHMFFLSCQVIFTQNYITQW